MQWTKALIAVLFLVPLFWLFSKGFGNDPHAVPFVLEGKPAAAFALKTLDGNTFDLNAHRGKPVVLNFWSTWCVPCKEEYPVLKSAAERLGDQVTFVGVIYQDTAENTSQFLRTHPLPFAQLLDEGSKVAMDYGVTGVPETVFINAQGNIVHKHNGVLTSHVLQGILQQF